MVWVARWPAGAVAKMLAIVAGLIAAASPVPAVAKPSPPDLDPKSLVEFFDAQVEPLVRARKIPGAVAVVVDGDKVVFAKGYGYADIDRREPVKPGETMFPIASVSKTFNYVLSAQLLEQGKIDADVDVNRYIRNFQIPKTDPRPITLRHLLSHTAGFERRAFLESYPSSSYMPPLADRVAMSLPARVRPPGVTPAYSNWGAAMVGLISENALKVPYRRAVETRLLAPLGMTHTSLDQDDRRGWATGYRNRDGVLRQQLPQVSYPPTGGVATTGLDMAKWIRGLLADDSPILTRQGRRTLFSPTFCTDPRLSCAAYGFYQIPRNGVRMFGHDGNKSGFTSSLILIPDRKIGFFMSVNTNGRTVTDVGNAFLDRFVPAPQHPMTLPMLPGAEMRIAALAGAYRSARQNYTTVERAVRMLTAEDADFTIRPVGPNAFERIAKGRTMLMIERAPNFFVEAGGQDSAVYRPALPGNPGQLSFSSETTTAFVQLAWYETATVTRILWAIMTGAALIVVVAAVRARSPRPARSAKVVADRAALAHAATFLLFQISWWAVIAWDSANANSAPRYYPDYPAFVVVPVILGSVGVLVAAALIACFTVALVFGRRTSGWTSAMALYAGISTLTCVTIWYWNLMGWPF